MPKIGVPGVLAVLSTHAHTAEARDWCNRIMEYMRYLVIANPMRGEMEVREELGQKMRVIYK